MSDKPWEMDWADAEEAPAGGQSAPQIKPWEMDWETVKPAAKPKDPTERMVAQARAFGAGLADPAIGLVQLLANLDPLDSLKQRLGYGRAEEALGIPLTTEGMNRYVQERERRLGEELPDTGVPRALGNILSPTSILPATRIAQASKLIPRIAQNMSMGAAFGATMPTPEEDFWDAKQDQAELGMMLGGAGTVATAPIARMVAPRVPAGVQELREMGVVPTLGQRLGDTANRIEQSLVSAPILGSAIREARNTTIKEFNTGIGNRILSRVGEKLPDDVPPGHETIDYVGKKLSEKYDTLLPKLKAARDPQFDTEIAQIESMAQGSFHPDYLDQFNRLLKHQLHDKFTTSGLASGETLKEIERQLGHYAAGAYKKGDFDSQQLGAALREAQAALRGMIERQNPAHRGELKAINRGWADFLRMENAASKIGTREGVFTPAQLKASARLYDPSRKKSAFARGEAPMQNIAETGQHYLGATVPDSGTPFRTAVGLGMLGGGYAVHPGILAAEIGTMVPYLRPGQVLADKLLSGGMGWRQPLGEMVRRVSTPVAAGGVGPLSREDLGIEEGVE